MDREVYNTLPAESIPLLHLEPTSDSDEIVIATLDTVLSEDERDFVAMSHTLAERESEEIAHDDISSPGSSCAGMPRWNTLHPSCRVLGSLDHHDSMDRNIYRPLPAESIRLLHLRPTSASNAPLLGTLETVALKDERAFEALSYTWGDPLLEGTTYGSYTWTGLHPLPGHLFLNGRIIPIAGNLCSALKQLRCTTEVKTLWVDALCINQNDDVEKSVQVAMMARIYAIAVRVIVWLGEDSPDRDGGLFFRLCQKRYRMMKYPYFGAWRKALSSILRVLDQRCLGGSGVQDQLMVAPFFCRRPNERFGRLTQFRERTWFNRRWCAQEAASARELMLVCGAHQLPWTVFQYVYERETSQKSLAWRKSWPMARYDPVEKIRKIRTVTVDMFDLLYELQNLKCSDTRDTIYALASILGKDPLGPTIMIDYTSTSDEVMINFAANLIASGNLSLIWRLLVNAAWQRMWHEVYPLPAPTVPSWVPDWSKRVGRYDGPNVLQGTHGSMPSRGTVQGNPFEEVFLTYSKSKQFLDDDCVYGLPQECFESKGHKRSAHCLILRPQAGHQFTILTVARHDARDKTTLGSEWRNITIV